MNILSAQGLGKAFGIKLLFERFSFGLEERDRIGVIGINGSGKSTLLKVLTGLEPADEGTLAVRRDLRMEYLSQSPEFDLEHTVLEHLFTASGDIAELVRDYEDVSHQLTHWTGDEEGLARLSRRFEELTRRMEAAGAWDFETRAKTILSKLGVEDFEAKIGTLSGGYRKRVALAHALLTEPDLLVLDEPTNHLDADSVGWLESYLMRFNGAVLLVTHDRYFLDRVMSRILEIDRGEVRLFEGNFSYYLEKKAEVEAAFASSENRRRAILQNELAWFRRGARARRTKEKARIKHLGELQGAAVSRQRDEIKFETMTRRLGKKIIELKGVSKAYLTGEEGTPGATVCRVVENLTYTFSRGERLGIIGPNGSGKTTLANLITGRLAPDNGVIEIGETVAFGYYAQENMELDPGERALDYIKREGGEMLRTADGSVLTASAVMERFLFTNQMQYAPVGKLSGGEQRRLLLVRALMRDPNFLILDEPTNDLDIATLQALEDYLDSFTGCLIVVSHDRYFLDRTVDHLIALSGDGAWRIWPGDYSSYAEMRAEEESARNRAGAQRGSVGAQPAGDGVAGSGGDEKKGPRKLSYKEQRELESLEAEIARIEARLEELQPEMAQAAADYARLRGLAEEQAALNARLEAAMARWEDLATRAAARS